MKRFGQLLAILLLFLGLSACSNNQAKTVFLNWIQDFEHQSKKAYALEISTSETDPAPLHMTFMFYSNRLEGTLQSDWDFGGWESGKELSDQGSLVIQDNKLYIPVDSMMSIAQDPSTEKMRGKFVESFHLSEKEIEDWREVPKHLHTFFEQVSATQFSQKDDKTVVFDGNKAQLNVLAEIITRQKNPFFMKLATALLEGTVKMELNKETQEMLVQLELDRMGSKTPVWMRIKKISYQEPMKIPAEQLMRIDEILPLQKTTMISEEEFKILYQETKEQLEHLSTGDKARILHYYEGKLTINQLEQLKILFQMTE